MQRAWLITVDMGYGHQRTIFPLKDKGEEIINANNYNGIPEKDKKIWEITRRIYEAISRIKSFPVFGELIFSILDFMQKIPVFYPKKDFSNPNFGVQTIYKTIKSGWGKDLIERLKAKPWPIVTSFFTPAFMADFYNYPNEIFCIVCDTDISRSWAPLEPQKSRIKYFAPTERVVERLKLYGVRKENIFFTGYPLPKENIGTEKMEILKEDLRRRLTALDPQKKYFQNYKILIEKHLGALPGGNNAPLTIMFSIGGAGAQKEIGELLLEKLREKIKQNKIKIILSVGTKIKTKNYFEKILKNFKLSEESCVEILFAEKIEEYFTKFNRALRKTDILWTKPSELSFYSALGIPIIIAPPIGSQEEFNKRWLLKSGFGTKMENLKYINEWLEDWINNGFLAEMAMEGFIEGQKMGVFKIKKIIQDYEKNI